MLLRKTPPPLSCALCFPVLCGPTEHPQADVWALACVPLSEAERGGTQATGTPAENKGGSALSRGTSCNVSSLTSGKPPNLSEHCAGPSGLRRLLSGEGLAASPPQGRAVRVATGTHEAAALSAANAQAPPRSANVAGSRVRRSAAVPTLLNLNVGLSVTKGLSLLNVPEQESAALPALVSETFVHFPSLRDAGRLYTEATEWSARSVTLSAGALWSSPFRHSQEGSTFALLKVSETDGTVSVFGSFTFTSQLFIR